MAPAGPLPRTVRSARAPGKASAGAFALGLLVAAWPTSVEASSVLEFPDNGSEQLGRGGAWFVRGSDPLAAFFAPAALAGQRAALTLSSNVTFRTACFQRLKASNDTTREALAQPGEVYPEVCKDGAPFPNPQLAAVWPVTDRLGIAFAVLGPSATGNATWPDFVQGPGGPEPSPQRYLLLRTSSLILFPTLAAGYEALPGLRVGAGFTWGIAHLSLANASIALNQDNLPASSADIKADVEASQAFFPGAVASVLYTPSPYVEMALWGRVSAPVEARGHVRTYANYFTRDAAAGNTSIIEVGDTRLPDCGLGDGSNACAGDPPLLVNLPIPSELKLGVRFRVPREGFRQGGHARDPLATDLFDVEVNLTYAQNGIIDAFTVRLPGTPEGLGTIPVAGTGVGRLPPIADVPKGYKDVAGFRIGADYNFVPGRFALRAGAFAESNGQTARYQNVDFVGSARTGLAAGMTLRLPLGGADLDVSVAYGHVFVADQTLSDPDAPGLPARAGSPCNPPGSLSGEGAEANCPGGLPKYRTRWPVNLGAMTNSFDVLNLGATLRF